MQHLFIFKLFQNYLIDFLSFFSLFLCFYNEFQLSISTSFFNFSTCFFSYFHGFNNATQLSNQMRNGISSRASCWVCNALAGLFLSPVYSIDMITMAVNTVCTSFKIQKPNVCSGIVHSFKVSFFPPSSLKYS